MTNPLARREIDSAADLGVRNSQPEGVGRVADLGDVVCWNNLGRNVVFADAGLRPHTIFGSTIFPDEDEPSQYDLDIHAILDVPEIGVVAVLNHFGMVRGFRRDNLVSRPEERLVEPEAEWSFVADVERTVAVAGRLVGSAPRSDGAIGLVVSARLDIALDGSSVLQEYGGTVLGEVTALGAVQARSQPLIAVGGDGRIALVPFSEGQIGQSRWETGIGFRAAMIAWHAGAIWASGPQCGAETDDYDWEQLSGGGYAVLDPADGTAIMSGRLPEDVAWGTGGTAVVPFGSLLAAIDRRGCLHLVDPRSGAARSTAPVSSPSLGIGHMAAVGDLLLCGFNRGGYRLHSFSESATESEGR